MRKDRRNFKDTQEKEYRKIFREYSEVANKYHRRESGEYINVEPYQHGWTRSLVLRDDIKNRRDAHIIKQILDMINVVQFSRDKEFTEYNWKTRRKEPRSINPKTISPEQYEKLGERYKKYFEKGAEFHKASHTVRYFYFFNSRFYFVISMSPNIVTQRWIPDGELESRYTEIRNKIERNGWWAKIDRVFGISHGRYRREDIRYHKYRNGYGDEFSDLDFDTGNITNDYVE